MQMHGYELASPSASKCCVASCVPWDGSEYDSDCTSYPVFEETDEILEMTGLELEEESRFGGGFRW